MSERCDHSDITPGELAEFDQQWAMVVHRLSEVLQTYAEVVADSPDCPIGPKGGLAGFLEEVTTHESCAELLACAIDRLYLLREGIRK